MIEQSRAPGSTAILTKKCHCQRYSNPASGENLTNTRLLGQMSSSEKSEGTLSQQFRKVLTQSALSFSIQDHQGLISYLFSHDNGVAANGKAREALGRRNLQTPRNPGLSPFSNPEGARTPVLARRSPGARKKRGVNSTLNQ